MTPEEGRALAEEDQVLTGARKLARCFGAMYLELVQSKIPHQQAAMIVGQYAYGIAIRPDYKDTE